MGNPKNQQLMRLCTLFCLNTQIEQRHHNTSVSYSVPHQPGSLMETFIKSVSMKFTGTANCYNYHNSAYQ